MRSSELAIALWLQSTPQAGRVAELGSFADFPDMHLLAEPL